ncbi:hypothetical protein [Kordiimonas sp.]|uniref:hypothetical protein n=1 Tax=Kordiimonas sp. TaxID=1970157 RepID=UPI003A8D7D78
MGVTHSKSARKPSILIRRVALLVAACQLGACVETSNLYSRDITAVTPRCNPVLFIVSLNNDDDDGRGGADFNQARLPANEDNLRIFTFNHPGAAKVFIGEPVLVRGGTSAVGKGANKRVRAYSVNAAGAPGRAFGFNQVYNTPVTFVMEGTHVSGGRNDFGFEYDYRNAQDQHICGPGAQGTVVDARGTISVEKGHGTNFSVNRKLLIDSTVSATSTWAPAGFNPTWQYDGTATIATPNALNTTFTSQQTLTPVANKDAHHLAARVTDSGMSIDVHTPLNITAPVHAEAPRAWQTRPVRTVTTPWLNANPGNISLFSSRIVYELQDQFHEDIKDSAWENHEVQIQENIGLVLTSPIPAVNAWMGANLSWTRPWVNKPNARINDNLNALQIPNNIIVVNNAGRLSFVPGLQAVGGVLMNLGTSTHQWEASVDGALPTVVTNNSFSVATSATRPRGGGIEIQLTSTYGVVTP